MIGKPSVSAGFTKIGSPALGALQSGGGSPSSTTWSTLTDGTTTLRRYVVDDICYTDKTLTALGFDGIESTDGITGDWVNIEAIPIGWSTYWTTHLFDEDDLLLNFDSRSGGSLIDSVSGETAQVLLPCYLNNASTSIIGDKTRASELLFDGNDHTIYFQFKMIADATPSGADNLIYLGSTGSVAAQRGLTLTTYYDRIRMYCADGSATLNTYLINPDATAALKNNGVFDCIIKIDGTGKTIKASIYNSAGVLQGVETNLDISSFAFNANQNYAAFTFKADKFVVDNFKKFAGIKSLSQCQTDTYVTGLTIHLPHVLSAIDISGNGNEFVHNGTTAASITYDFISSWLLDNGYDRYKSITTLAAWHPMCIAHTEAGTQTTPDYTAGKPWITARIIGERDGNAILNLYDIGAIRFTNDFFDRSNVTIWNDTCRAASDYNAADTKFFLISNLNYRTLYGWLNDGYRGRLYINMTLGSIENFDRQLSYFKNIYLYTTDHKGTENRNILLYTKDNKCAVLSGAAYTYDAEGYVKIGTLKTIKPMLLFRNDDGTETTYTQWYPYFDAQGIKLTNSIIQEKIGTAGYQTLAQIKALYDAGWETSFHANEYLADYNDIDYVTLIETDLASLQTILTANGSPFTSVCGARYSSDNPAMGYFVNKHGYKVNFASGGLNGSNNGVNPQVIDKFNLAGIATDLAGDYNLDQADHLTELQNIYDELDLCVSGNQLLIIFSHSYSANVKTGYDSIIAYCVANGITIVNIDQALANCKYQ